MDRLKALLTKPSTLVGIGIFCCLLSVFFHWGQKSRLNQLEARVLYLQSKNILAEEKKKKEEKALSQMRVAEPGYVENRIEHLSFLKPEAQKLKALLHTDPQNQTHKARLHFLESGENRIHLKEQNFQRVGDRQEVELSLSHPIEMDGEDLKNLLAHLENRTIGSYTPKGSPPYFLIKQFEMQKKQLPTDEETFVVKFKLMKQEIVHE